MRYSNLTIGVSRTKKYYLLEISNLVKEMLQLFFTLKVSCHQYKIQGVNLLWGVNLAVKDQFRTVSLFNLISISNKLYVEYKGIAPRQFV